MTEHPRPREQAGQAENAEVSQGMAVEVFHHNTCSGPGCLVLQELGDSLISEVMQEGGANNKGTAVLFPKRLLCIALKNSDFGQCRVLC